MNHFQATRALIILLVTLLLMTTTGQPVQARSDGLARTPPMGWNSWQRFGCDISEKLIRDQADALVSSGLAAAGYRYVIVDDCWQAEKRDPQGRLVSQGERFKGGMKALGDYIHSRGLKFGIYSSRGAVTCANRPGSEGIEELDALTFASWGVDYVKYDNCPSGASEGTIRGEYEKMADALRRTGRPIIFSIAAYSFRDWHPGAAHLSRTSSDIKDNWDAMLHNFDENANSAAAARPGYWNDPDHLEIGNGGMNSTEYRTMFSLWAVSAAPLIISTDLRALSGEMKGILLNREVIAIDQDRAGVQAVKVAEPSGGLQVWSKRLASGEYAVALLNRTGAAANITVNWKDVSPTLKRAAVRNLWSQSGLGTYADGFTSLVQPHGVTLIKVSPR